MGEPVIRPFRAVRYDEQVAGDLGKLLAPPYDVSSPDLIARLLDRSPLNMIHLEHVRPDPGDDPHALAAERYRQWLTAGVLRRDDRPAFYAYDHTFTLDGHRRTRRGIFAAVHLARWDERIVLPHERTFPGPVTERLGRLRAVGANLSPIYLLADDRTGAFAELLSDSPVEPLADSTDPDGESHRIARIDDAATISRLIGVVAASQLFVADGHHRYEAALALRDQSERPPGSDFVLAMIADARDPNVVILPTHRVVRDLPDFDAAAIRARLATVFSLERLQAASGQASATPDRGAFAGGTISLLRFAGEEIWWRLTPRPDTAHLASMPSQRSDAWRELPAAILESVVFDLLGLAGGTFAPEVRFTHETSEAIASVFAGEAQIVFLLPAPTVSNLIAVARAGDRMPPKSTYFAPKVPAGLAVYDFAGSTV